jgi:hypothetical protein
MAPHENLEDAIDRHSASSAPSGEVAPPSIGGTITLHKQVLKSSLALPYHICGKCLILTCCLGLAESIPGIEFKAALRYGMSL